MPTKPRLPVLGHDHSGCPACSGDVYGGRVPFNLCPLPDGPVE